MRSGKSSFKPLLCITDKEKILCGIQLKYNAVAKLSRDIDTTSDNTTEKHNMRPLSIVILYQPLLFDDIFLK